MCSSDLLVGRVYLPERVRLIERTDGTLDLECAESVFAAIDRDPVAAAAARHRVLAMRKGSADYPITISDVSTADPANTPLRTLVELKLHGEALLNTAQRAARQR